MRPPLHHARHLKRGSMSTTTTAAASSPHTSTRTSAETPTTQVLSSQFIDVSHHPESDSTRLPTDFHLWPHFLSPDEHDRLAAACERKLRRQRYQTAHFDHVIRDYREVQVSHWDDDDDAKLVGGCGGSSRAVRLSSTTQQKSCTSLDPTQTTIRSILDRARHAIRTHFAQVDDNPSFQIPWKPDVHVLDLAATGSIGAHVDHPRYSGGFVCALSLLSDCVLRLEKVDKKCDEREEMGGTASSMTSTNTTTREDTTTRTIRDATMGTTQTESPYIDILLPRGSLYAQRGTIRYGYRHAIVADCLPDGRRVYRWNPSCGQDEPMLIEQRRRISVMFRDRPVE